MAVVLPLGWLVFRTLLSVGAGAIAASACLLGAYIGLAIDSCLNEPQLLQAKLWLGMSARMGIPLAAALVVHFSGGPLAAAGFLYYIVAFYPVSLAAETLLSLSDAGANN
jgi:hypothetical protein